MGVFKVLFVSASEIESMFSNVNNHTTYKNCGENIWQCHFYDYLLTVSFGCRLFVIPVIASRLPWITSLPILANPTQS